MKPAAPPRALAAFNRAAFWICAACAVPVVAWAWLWVERILTVAVKG